MQSQLDRQDKKLHDVDEKFSKLTDELSTKITSSIAAEHRFSEACSDRVKTQVRAAASISSSLLQHTRVP